MVDQEWQRCNLDDYPSLKLRIEELPYCLVIQRLGDEFRAYQSCGNATIFGIQSRDIGRALDSLERTRGHMSLMADQMIFLR